MAEYKSTVKFRVQYSPSVYCTIVQCVPYNTSVKYRESVQVYSVFSMNCGVQEYKCPLCSMNCGVQVYSVYSIKCVGVTSVQVYSG